MKLFLRWVTCLVVSSVGMSSATLAQKPLPNTPIPDGPAFEFNAPPAAETTPERITPINPEVITQWQNARLVRTLRGHVGSVDSVAFSPDNQVLMSGGGRNDGQIRLWWVRTGTNIDNIRAHRTAVLAIAASPNGAILASGSDDSVINLWQWKSRSKAQYTRTFVANTSNVLAMDITPDSQTLISGSLDGIRLWDLRTQRPLYILNRFDMQTYALATNPQGETFASGGKNKVIYLWQIGTGTQIGALMGHTAPIRALAYSPDGKILVSGSEDRTIKIWDVATGRILYTLEGHTGAIQDIAMHPSGQIFVSVSRDGTRLWNLQTGELIRYMSDHTDWVRSVAFSPDGKTLATGGFDRLIHLWQIPPVQAGNSR